jgi:hypothetical protein
MTANEEKLAEMLLTRLLGGQDKPSDASTLAACYKHLAIGAYYRARSDDGLPAVELSRHSPGRT